MGVATKMSNAKSGGLVLSTEEAVVGALADLGHERVSFGNVRHDFPVAVLTSVP